MKEEKNISNTLESQRPSLSQEDRLVMWNAISQKLPTQTPIPSPFLSLVTYKTIMTPLVVLLILILGGGGTALASDAARPGDFLFPLERSIENTQLSLAFSGEAKEALTKHFTEERLRELREIIDEELVISPSNIDVSASNDSAVTATSTSGLEIEVNVFTDMTVVKLELDDQKFYFEAQSNTREGVIAEIIERFPMLTQEQIESQLAFEIEDRESRPKDRGVVSLSDAGQTRINHAVDAILSFLNVASLDDIKKEDLRTLLSSEVEGVTKIRRDDDAIKIGSGNNRFEIRMNDDGDSRVEFRDGKSRIRIEEKDGEVRVQSSNSNSGKGSEDKIRTSLSTVASSSIVFEVEADVFTDTTIIKIEIADQDFTFETDAQTRSEVIDEIQKRFPVLTKEQIDAELDFQIEDRASKKEDGGIDTNSDDDKSYDDDDDAEDEYEDDDSSGHGRGGDREDDENEKDEDDD